MFRAHKCITERFVAFKLAKNGTSMFGFHRQGLTLRLEVMKFEKVRAFRDFGKLAFGRPCETRVLMELTERADSEWPNTSKT
jgi:hypothetical protein